jgi:phosphoenolpyruvate synthase/pyruvate phosphate dikinase
MIPVNKKAEKNINTYILGFKEIDRSKLMIVGGKGANLGELSGITGILGARGFLCYHRSV